MTHEKSTDHLEKNRIHNIIFHDVLYPLLVYLQCSILLHQCQEGFTTTIDLVDVYYNTWGH